ncbi:MAG TPA: Rne/Rng family ribonuclease [Alphaproteobacteria bacterium]|nr:Rne/Rng family ribonuclease [Alphaproteobacteria bacterium]
MGSEILIDTTSHETRVALLENGSVAELYVERERDKGIVGNIYKGLVTKILPGMQAAFVDLGLRRAGFLYVADVESVEGGDSLEKLVDEESIDDDKLLAERRRFGRRAVDHPIEELLQQGQDILVQVSKEPIGTKGARVTSYITLPGRYLVFMPMVDHIGVSRRIANEEERQRLKDIVREAKAPGVGFIVRTVSEGVDRQEIHSDMAFLTRLWEDIQKRAMAIPAPNLVHPDLNILLRTVRDLFTSDVDRLILDSPQDYETCLDFVRSYLPHLEAKIQLYPGKEPLFEAYGVELEIERALGRKIWLKSGGYIVIDQTEALVAIDVNTGRFVGRRNPEETILQTNLEAVKEIVYQLRLRNIGGIIIIDFIDMEHEESREKVYNALLNALRSDRSRTRITKISELGLVEMTRKRVRESLGRVLCRPCPYCDGSGAIKSAVTICYEILREIRRAASTSQRRRKIVVQLHPVVADILLEEERGYLEALEEQFQKQIVIKGDYDLHEEQYEVMLLS